MQYAHQRDPPQPAVRKLRCRINGRAFRRRPWVRTGRAGVVIRQTLFRLSQQPQLRSIATTNPMAQSVARRFVAGETLEEALATVADINAQGMTATLDHLGENVTGRHEAVTAADDAIRSFRAIQEAGVRCNASVKLTQLGLDIDPGFASENLSRVVQAAAQYENFVRIDMESSEYVDRTLEIFAALFSTHRNVGVVIQACLYRSASDLEQVVKAGARVRLVKGAYLEPPAVAFQRKEDVDSNFVRLSELLLAHGTYPAIATHDPRMVEAAQSFARSHDIPNSAFEFQMLYGIRRDLQSQLVRAGHNVRIYVPYGPHWYPYLMRRMAERPANVMFVLNNLAREARGRRR
jgi:proline dehydrogenase